MSGRFGGRSNVPNDPAGVAEGNDPSARSIRASNLIGHDVGQPIPHSARFSFDGRGDYVSFHTHEDGPEVEPGQHILVRGFWKRFPNTKER